MSLSINMVQAAGRLTRDPNVRTINDKSPVADFGLAINHRYKTKAGDQKEEVTFVDVECWGTTAVNVGKFLKKGSSCFVVGRLKLDSWQDKEGQKRSKLKVVADSVQFMDAAPKPMSDTDPIVVLGGGDSGSDEPPFAPRGEWA